MATSSPSRIRFACPSCDHRVAVDATAAGKRGRCPNCATVSTVPPCTASSAEINNTPSERQTPVLPPPVLQTPVLPPPIIPEPILPPAKPDIEVDDVSYAICVQDPSIRRRKSLWGVAIGGGVLVVVGVVIIATILAPHIMVPVFALLSLIPYCLFSAHRARRVRYVLYYGGWLGPVIVLLWMVVVATKQEHPSPGYVVGKLALAGLWFYFGHHVARLLTPAILGAVFSRLTCPHCREAVETTGLWNCGCGYVDHKESNIFLFHCPQCRERFGSTNCPRCEATILI